jgi:hypothetical protein
MNTTTVSKTAKVTKATYHFSRPAGRLFNTFFLVMSIITKIDINKIVNQYT